MERMTRFDWLVLAALTGLAGWVALWWGVMKAIDRVEYRLDEIAGEDR